MLPLPSSLENSAFYIHVALASGHILGPVPELMAKTPFSPGQLSNPPVTPPKILCEGGGCGAILNIAMTSMFDQPSLHPWAVAYYFSACDLTSCRIFLSLSCLPTSFIHSPGQQLSLLLFFYKNKCKGGGRKHLIVEVLR